MGLVVRDSPLPMSKWTTVISESRDTPLRALAHLELAQWLHYRGLYDPAQDHYAAVLAAKQQLPGVEYWAAFGLGELAAQGGGWAEAAGWFAQCRQCPDTPLAAEALLRRGECLEFQGLVKEATTANQEVAGQEKYPASIRRRADYALKRLAESERALAYLAQHGKDWPVRYVGQDRLTQGDWRTYGREFLVLCAAQGSSDISGGVLAPLAVRADTTQPDKRVYWWQFSHDPDAANHCAPLAPRCGPHNWDDGGEKYPPGTGPDMVVTLPVPAGTYRLSVYFVSDHNYYEPNRRYTVYVTEAQSKAVLAAAPVRDFRHGVYLQFQARGPCDLRLRIWRNVSLNTLLTGVFLDNLAAVPHWEALRAEALAEGRIQPDAPVDYTLCAATWEAFRRSFGEGADRPAQGQALRRFAEAVKRTLSPYWAGRALESVALYLLGLGYVGQSSVLEGEALELIEAQSQRRYGEALLRAVESFGALRPYVEIHNSMDFRPLAREGLVYASYAVNKVRQYGQLVHSPRSLVSSEDIAKLGNRCRREGRLALARACFEMLATEGDLWRLTRAEEYAYAQSLQDPAAKVAVLPDLLARGDPLPRPETSLRSEMAFLELSRGNLEAAEAETKALLALPGNADTKYFAAYRLATAFRQKGDKGSAERWARLILTDFPDSPVAPEMRRLLEEIAGGSGQQRP